VVGGFALGVGGQGPAVLVPPAALGLVIEQRDAGCERPFVLDGKEQERQHRLAGSDAESAGVHCVLAVIPLAGHLTGELVGGRIRERLDVQEDRSASGGGVGPVRPAAAKHAGFGILPERRQLGIATGQDLGDIG
jgi:hypothetical protein